MNMHILNKIFVFFLLILIISSCQKDDIVYDINQLQSSSYNANKNKQKSIGQYISIVYANLFQKALSSNELVEITRCIESIGDKQVAHEIVLSNFMNSDEVIIPSDSLMRADLDVFLEETYKRFFVREITASLARSMEASVCPARLNTPPSLAFNGKI